MQAYLVLAVDGIAAADAAGSGGRATARSVVAPACAALPVGTIPGHVAGVATDAADDAGGVVLALGTVVLAVTDLAAVLAGLVLVVAEGTVEGGELTKLVSLELVLTFGDGGGLAGQRQLVHS